MGQLFLSKCHNSKCHNQFLWLSCHLDCTSILSSDQPCQTQLSKNRAPRKASATTPLMFFTVMLRSKMLDSNRTIAAPKDATPKTIKASADCNQRQVAPNPKKKLPNVERISEMPTGAIGPRPTKAAIVFGKSNAAPPTSIRSTAATLGAN